MYFILESSVNDGVVDIPLGVLLEGVDGDTCSGDVESLGTRWAQFAVHVA